MNLVKEVRELRGTKDQLIDGVQNSFFYFDRDSSLVNGLSKKYHEQVNH